MDALLPCFLDWLKLTASPDGKDMLRLIRVIAKPEEVVAGETMMEAFFLAGWSAGCNNVVREMETNFINKPDSGQEYRP